jgi:hypothetical protein
MKYALALLLSSFPLFAQAAQCAPDKEVEELLLSRYGEVVIFEGATAQGLVQLWINDITGTWTATVSTNGQTCLVSSGEEGVMIDLPPNL